MTVHDSVRYERYFEPWRLWINHNADLDGRKFKFTFGNWDVPGVDNFWSLKGHAYRIFFVEVKTNGAGESIKPSQRIPYTFNHQVYRAAHGNKFPVAWHKGETPIPRTLEYRGTHLWQLSDTTPDDSEWMEWNGVPIDTARVIRFFRFEESPLSYVPKSLANPLFKPAVER